MNEEFIPGQEIPEQMVITDTNPTQNLVEPVVLPTSDLVAPLPPVISTIPVDIVSTVPVAITTPMPTKPKSMVKYIVLLIILGLLIALGYRNYRTTTISYTATIPVGFFDDKERIVVKDDQYKKLNDFMSGSYQNLLKSTSKQYSDDIMSGFYNALLSGDKEYILQNKQILIDLEKLYMQDNFFNKLYAIVSTGNWGHIDPNTPSFEIPNDYFRSPNDLIRHISLFMILRCSIEETENRCQGYQLLSKALVAKTQRKSGYIGDLIHWNIQKYLIQQEKISHTTLDLCKDLGNPEQVIQNTLKDEYNVLFKSMINDTISEVIKSLENNEKMSERVPNFIFRAINKDKLAQEIKSQAERKGEQRFYNLIQGNDNNSFLQIESLPPLTKMILATLGIAPNYLLGDILSDELVAESFPRMSIKEKYKALSELCKTK